MSDDNIVNKYLIEGCCQNNDAMPDPTRLKPINDIYESEIVYPTLPVENVSFDILNLRKLLFYNYGMRCKQGDEVSKDECQQAVELSKNGKEELQYNVGTWYIYYSTSCKVNVAEALILCNLMLRMKLVATNQR